ncbi:MAG: hypothetical protein KF810_02770 [Rhizobiaceae bacterium]|nr:hypothetical protein [Rhizobiaceae bacterium]
MRDLQERFEEQNRLADRVLGKSADREAMLQLIDPETVFDLVTATKPADIALAASRAAETHKRRRQSEERMKTLIMHPSHGKPN